MKRILFVLPLLFLFVGCDETVNEKEAGVVRRQQEIYTAGQPAPVFDWSLQRQIFNDYYKCLNNTVSTWSVIMDHGEPKSIIPSIGEPIPLGTQLTNPQAVDWVGRNGNGYAGFGFVLPQAEPNGLYSPSNSRGTIIMAVDGPDGVAPVYSEPDVICYPYPVQWNPATRMMERVPGSVSSMHISTAKRAPTAAPAGQK